MDRLRHTDLRGVRKRAVTRDDFRRQADFVRAIPLEVVLTSWGAVRDQRDKSRWHTPRGPLSVTGTKFFSWPDSHGGGGAIDLVMHLGGWDARQAIGWLWRHVGCHAAGANPTADTRADADPTSSADSTSGSASSSRRSAPPGHDNVGHPTRRARANNSTCPRRTWRIFRECVATLSSSVVCQRRSWLP